MFYNEYETYVTTTGHLDVPAERFVAGAPGEEGEGGEGVTVPNNAISCRIL